MLNSLRKHFGVWAVMLGTLSQPCLETRLTADAPPLTINLWPGAAPGETDSIGEEKDLTKPTDNDIAGKPVIRLGNISTPTLTVYRPSPQLATGTSVLVFPGGGYHILAMDLEGTEVCEWLNSIGVTGILLKYRVPKRTNLEKHVPALQDAQRALGLVRENASKWQLNSGRIGVLGFSAGGHLAAALSNNFEERTYPLLDAADRLSCRPDFAVLIYPGGLTLKDENDRIAPEMKISSHTPPTFIAMTQDDGVRVENAVFYYLALKKAGVAAELHVYPKGGHGYGLRRTNLPVTTWPDRVADWMKAQSWLNR